jgi:hypothetical protein
MLRESPTTKPTPAPSRALTRDLALAALGPALLGGALALTESAPLAAAWTLPAAVAGTLVMTWPALYVGTALVGSPYGAHALLTRTTAAARDMGLACLGMLPAVAFLGATTSAGGGGAAGAAALLGATLVGMFGLSGRLGAARRGAGVHIPTLATLGGWAMVTLGIGRHLVHDVL